MKFIQYGLHGCMQRLWSAPFFCFLKEKDCTGPSRANIEKTLMRSTFQDEPSCVRMAQINYIYAIYGRSGCEGLFSFGCCFLTSFDVDRLYRRVFFCISPIPWVWQANTSRAASLHMASKHFIKTVPYSTIYFLDLIKTGLVLLQQMVTIMVL